MTRAAHAVLLYLDRYLRENPKQRRALHTLYRRTTGKKLHPAHFWKHTSRKVEPSLSASLVYLIFLSRAGELLPTDTPGALFTYKHPEWLKARK